MEKKYKVHMMYKDCEGIEAKTMEQHLKLKKEGYTHKKSNPGELIMKIRSAITFLAMIILVGMLAVSGCGQKGPLYQPDDNQKKDKKA